MIPTTTAGTATQAIAATAGRSVAAERARPNMRFSLLLLAAIVAAYIICGMQSLDKPGLYMDAVDPDYLVARIVNPNTPTEYWLAPGNLLFNRFPVLAGPYSGSYVAYLLVPFYVIFGGTLTAIRLAHFALGLSIVIAAFFFLRESTRSLTLAAMVSAVLAVDPAFTMPFRTQAYIVLFPVVMTISAAYVLVRFRSMRGTFAAGVLLGLSVFGYFVFGFALPGVVVFVFLDGPTALRRERIASLCAGIAVGCLPYVLGYGLMFAALGSVQAGLAAMFATFFGLHVDSGQSYADRFASVMHWIWRMSTADWDALTFWGIDRDDVGQTVKAALLMLLPIAALPFAFSRVGPARGFRLTTLATVSFALVATFFGQRLGGHDLTPTLPLLYVTAGSAVALIAVQPRLGRLSRVFAGAALACGIVLFGLNAHTAAALTARLAQHSADGLFSSIFSDYPAAALAAGDKTPHIFWQWGSLFQFIYGTEGKIPAYSSGGLTNALCTYGQAKIVLTGAETAHHPDLDFAAQRVTVANVRLLHDAYSGYPYEIITVRPIGDACETPRAPPSAAVPAGLHLPEGTFANASIPFEGVYPVAAGDGCCFLSDRAVFGVRAPRAARNLRFTIYTLNYPQVPPQHLTFLIDGKTALRSGVLPKGIVSTVDVPLPRGSRGKPALRVEIEATSFVPKEIGINGEPRRLSVVLSSVTAGAAATPSPVAAAATRVTPGNAAASAAPPTTYDFTASARPLRVPDGLFVDDSSGCCFAGKRVTFDLSIPPGSTQVNVTLYPPDLPKHPGQAASMIATFNGKHPITVNGLIPGALKTYAIPLPAAVRTKTRLALTLAFPQTFVPRDEGINGDTRTLSVVIRSVAFAR